MNFLIFNHSDIFKKIKEFFTHRPFSFIFLISLLSIILANYPVIFFNKSFVSQVGIHTIGENGEWVKNFKFDGDIEDFRGSDIGALTWSIKPNSVVSGNSIFQYNEFPFYNRYTGAGVPLFGQASNSIGDPLNLIPYFFTNHALGWDVKFILSRFFFVFGIGVLLYILNPKNISSILTVTFSSSFLGYFAFRFNHPAVFCLTYAPWLLVAWLSYAKISSNRKTSSSLDFFTFIILIIFSLFMITSGPIKETIILTGYIHFAGLLCFFFTKSSQSLSNKITKLLLICFSIFLVNMPYIFTFIDTLKLSFTAYETPSAQQLEWINVLFLFKSFKSIQVSTNLFFLFCCVSFFVITLKNRSKLAIDYRYKAILYPALFSCFIVFSIIPGSILINIPYINNIHHLWNVFSIPAIFSIIVLSALGLRFFLESSLSTQKIIFKVFMIIFFTLYLLNYKLKTFDYILLLLYFLFFLIMYLFFFHGKYKVNAIKIIPFVLILLLPEGQHLMTSIKGIDKNIVNPMPRLNENLIPDSVLFIKEQSINIPSRAIGEGYTFFPGFNSQIGIESIIPVEPLRNKNFDDLLNIIEYPNVLWGWLRTVNFNQFESIKNGLNLLGVRFVLGKRDISLPPSFNLVFQDDLYNVWENPNFWPRAFFSNNLKLYKTDNEFKEILLNSNEPFVGIEDKFEKDFVFNYQAKIHYEPAFDYILTNNKTEFTIDIPVDGFVVLSNAYYPNDFVIKANNKKVDYFRVNKAFIGIFIEKPGVYHFEAEYRPKNFNLYLCISTVGLFFGIFSLIIFFLIRNAKNSRILLKGKNLIE